MLVRYGRPFGSICLRVTGDGAIEGPQRFGHDIFNASRGPVPSVTSTALIRSCKPNAYQRDHPPLVQLHRSRQHATLPDTDDADERIDMRLTSLRCEPGEGVAIW